MSFQVDEITVLEVEGFNKSVIRYRNQNSNSNESSFLIRRSDLESCLGAIFYRGFDAKYVNAPIEKMAGLLLYRISQLQSFENGNKRTALVTCYFFLKNNGYEFKFKRIEINNLLWGFAKGNNLLPRYNENDGIQFIKERITAIFLSS